MLKHSLLILLSTLAAASAFAAENSAEEYPSQVGIRAGQLIQSEKYDALEQLAKEYREKQIRFPSSTWKLDLFYEAWNYCWDGKPNLSRSALIRGVCREQLTKWRDAKPKSVTPLVALAKNYYADAWRVRGGNYANGLGDSQLEGFAQLLQKAWEISDQAMQFDDTDPHLLALRLTLAHELGAPEEVTDRLFADAIRKQPAYYEVYQVQFRFLQPKWGGSASEFRTFLDWAAKHTAPEIGKGMYALATTRLDDEQLYNELGVSWADVYQGFQDLDKKFPNSRRNWARLARSAEAADDKAAAKFALAKLGTQWDEYTEITFGSPKELERLRHWANSPGSSTRPEIHIAVQQGDVEAVKTLIKAGVNLSAQDDVGRSAIAIAVWNNNLPIAKLLMDAGARIGGEINGMLPLNIAAFHGNLEMLLLMLKHEHPANLSDSEGYYPIHLAAGEGFADVVRLLMKQPGVDVNGWSKGSQETPLIRAVFLNRKEIVETLLSDSRVDINKLGTERNITPLHVAVEGNHLEMVKLLLSHGARTNISCGQYGTASDRARKLGFREIARLISESSPSKSEVIKDAT